jgi:hypothetical protein
MDPNAPKGPHIPPVPAPSGWKVAANDQDVCRVDSLAPTGIAERWETRFGGSGKQGFDVIRNQAAMDALWAGFKSAPEKPKVNFDQNLLVVIQTGNTITRYDYQVVVCETPERISFSVFERPASKDGDTRLGQAAILAFKLPKIAKEINVQINRATGSKGHSPKRRPLS